MAALQNLPDSKCAAALAVKPVVLLFGLTQRWNLFAPEIRTMNQYSMCLITFRDGSQRLYEWPRIELLSVFDRFTYLKVRRFVSEYWANPFDNRSKLWPYGAPFMVAASFDPDNPPATITNIFRGQKVPPFDQFTRRANMPRGYVLDATMRFPVNRSSMSTVMPDEKSWQGYFPDVTP